MRRLYSPHRRGRDAVLLGSSKPPTAAPTICARSGMWSKDCDAWKTMPRKYEALANTERSVSGTDRHLEDAVAALAEEGVGVPNLVERIAVRQ